MLLRGVLARSFENILCLRGYATLKDLENLSFPDENYQRDEIETHSKDIAEFLDSGEYTFFPEIVLGASLVGMGFSMIDIDLLYSAVTKGSAFTLRNIKDIAVSTFVKRFKRGMEVDFHTTGSFYKLKPKSFSRIDGNHRLQAVAHASERIGRYMAPFCLVLFQDDEERQRFGRVFFHMINFRAEPISAEKNLQLILDTDDFDEERLLRSPFGVEFVLARKCLRNPEFKKSRVGALSHTALVGLFRYLKDSPLGIAEPDKRSSGNSEGKEQASLKETTKFFQAFIDKINNVNELLEDNALLAQICAANENILASLWLVRTCMEDAFSEYLAWLLDRARASEGEVLMNESFEQIVNLFQTGREKRKRTIFVSMQFGSCGTEQNFKTIQKVVERVNKDHACNPPLEIVRIDQRVSGKTFEINEQIINQLAQCGYLIADLTYCNSNVYHEIGMLMGRTLALTDKHEYNMALILDQQVSEENKIVKFNLKSLQYLAFSKQKELFDGLKKRIEKFYGL